MCEVRYVYELGVFADVFTCASANNVFALRLILLLQNNWDSVSSDTTSWDLQAVNRMDAVRKRERVNALM